MKFMVKHQVPGLNDQKIGKKFCFFMKTKFTKEFEKCLQRQTLVDLMQNFTKEIRSKLRDKAAGLKHLLY